MLSPHRDSEPQALPSLSRREERSEQPLHSALEVNLWEAVAAASTQGLTLLSVLLSPSPLLSSTPRSSLPLLPVPAVSPGLELCDPTQRLRVALAGELVGVGGHFLFLGLALVSKDWRFLQRMITAPCILFLFYGSVSPSTCCLAIPFSTSYL